MDARRRLLTLAAPCWIALGGSGCAVAGRDATLQAVRADQLLQREWLVEHGTTTSHARLYGLPGRPGPHVALLPSLGRGVEDFTETYRCTLTTRLVQAGYRVVLVQPRGAGLSRGDLAPAQMTMDTLADDLVASFDALGIAQAHLVGHAFGNRLARYFTARHPQRVGRLALLASGGAFDIAADVRRALTGSFDLSLPDAQRRAMLQKAFFAPDNDPSIWLDGWYPALARAQIAATRSVPADSFRAAGGKPFLLVQALDDTVAPPQLAGRPLKAQLGDRVTYVEIARAGHALTSEQPEAIARHLIAYLGGA